MKKSLDISVRLIQENKQDSDKRYGWVDCVYEFCEKAFDAVPRKKTNDMISILYKIEK